MPAAFTAVTGAAHWHVLLKARAIENQCYVLAAAQGGVHPGGRRTYGHSLFIDPWGVVLAEREEEGPGIVIGAVEPERLAQVRARLAGIAASAPLRLNRDQASGREGGPGRGAMHLRRSAD